MPSLYGIEKIAIPEYDLPIPPGWGFSEARFAVHTHDHDHHEKHAAQMSDSKRDALKRLNYIEGHLSGIERMVEQDTYCVDILKQTFAVRRAIQKLEAKLLEGHLNSCVIEGVKEGREQEVLGELMELYNLSDKR